MHGVAVDRNCVDEQTVTLLSAGGGWHEGGGEVPGSGPHRELESTTYHCLAGLLVTPSQVELASVNCKCC
jgi:hypothetical protein